MQSTDINRTRAVPTDPTRKVQKTGSDAHRKKQAPQKKKKEDEGEDEEEPKDKNGKGKIVNVVA